MRRNFYFFNYFFDLYCFRLANLAQSLYNNTARLDFVDKLRRCTQILRFFEFFFLKSREFCINVELNNQRKYNNIIFSITQSKK